MYRLTMGVCSVWHDNYKDTNILNVKVKIHLTIRFHKLAIVET